MFTRIIRPSNNLLKSNPLRRLNSTTSNIPDIKLTFFTKENCQLCNEAKEQLSKVFKDPKIVPLISQIETEFVDIEAKGNENWFECYRFDIPVLHVDREDYKRVTFMHRLNVEEVIEELSEEL